MKKTIGILTTFYRFDPGYSLCAVVQDQLIALVKHGYKTVLFVLPSFNDHALVPKGVEIRAIVPQLILEPYKGLNVPDHWQQDVQKARDMFVKNMQDIDVLIAHDIFFIDTYLPYNIAMREALPHLTLNVLAWTHSAPSQRIQLENNMHANRYNLGTDRIKLVYLNHDKVIHLAEMYGAQITDVAVVNNSRDVRTFWDLDPFVLDLIDRYDLLSADILSVYPLSTPRMIAGKGLDKVIRLHAGLQKLGYTTHLIVCNAHANAKKEKETIAQTLIFAADQGCVDGTVIFTSLVDAPKHEEGVNGKIVSDLFRLANVFVFPTVSENSSLVLLEAMLAGNLLVLNGNVPTLREHAGNRALYFDFSPRDNEEGNRHYYADLAKITAARFESEWGIQAKRRALKQFNYDQVFRNIEHLIYQLHND